MFQFSLQPVVYPCLPLVALYEALCAVSASRVGSVHSSGSVFNRHLPSVNLLRRFVASKVSVDEQLRLDRFVSTYVRLLCPIVVWRLLSSLLF